MFSSKLGEFHIMKVLNGLMVVEHFLHLATDIDPTSRTLQDALLPESQTHVSVQISVFVKRPYYNVIAD